MGACSSKPKTTEFEGSMEPKKQTEMAADQSQEAERRLENLADDHGKEAPAKAGEGEREGTDASTESVQTTRELEVDKDDGPSKEVFVSSAEGTSASQSAVLGEKEAVNKEASDEFEQKESKGNGVPEEVVQKDDAVADAASVNKEGAQDKAEESLMDEAKTCEDKAVVSEETGSNQGDALYVDKAVALDEVKALEALETPEKRNIIVPEGEAGSVLASVESASIESPITGLIQPVESMKEEVVPESATTKSGKDGETVMPFKDPQEDFKVADKSLAREVGDEDGHVSVTEDAQKDVLKSAGEASLLTPSSVEETFPPVSALETLAPAETDPSEDFEEGTSQPQGEAPTAVVNVSPAIQTDVEECPTDTKRGAPLDGSVDGDSHAGTVRDEAMKMESTQISNPEVSSIEPNTEYVPQESSKETGGFKVEEMGASNGHALATEEANEDGSPKVTSGGSAPQREEKAEQAIEKPFMEHAASVDVTFEDASDAPLKLEPSNSIEPGQVPS